MLFKNGAGSWARVWWRGWYWGLESLISPEDLRASFRRHETISNNWLRCTWKTIGLIGSGIFPDR
jgi:hypothetical protein